MEERIALIGLTLVPQLAPLVVKRLLEACGSAAAIWAASEAQLRVEGVSAAAVAAVLREQRGIEQRIERMLVQAQRLGVTLVTTSDAEYPLSLRTIYDPPPALYVRGTLVPADATAVAIVGSRHPTPYGVDVAERFGRELAKRGIAVVSGLARGIDGAAHRGALAGGGRTIAVLGGGLARLYPPEHRRLADDIARSGAVVSEFALETSPDKLHFPRRNRLISGLSLGIVVVEAAEKSGALITAGAAAEQGRDVLAVPGKITSPASAGAHALLKDGATLVTSVEDICAALRLAWQPTAATASVAPDTTPQERLVLDCLSDEPLHVDDLALAAHLTPAALSSILLALELRELVRQWPGSRYTVFSQAVKTACLHTIF